jgi:hypothetical protein
MGRTRQLNGTLNAYMWQILYRRRRKGSFSNVHRNARQLEPCPDSLESGPMDSHAPYQRPVVAATHATTTSYHETRYQAGTWTAPRRALIKAEVGRYPSYPR